MHYQFNFARIAWPARLLGVFFLLLPLYACAADQQPRAVDAATIAVTGSASVDVVPDQLSFTLGVAARGSTVSSAYQQVENNIRQVMAILRGLDIPQHDIQAMHLSLQPVIDYKNQQKVVGHDARRDVLVKLQDIERYAEVIEGLSAVDSLRFSNLQLHSSERDALQQEALESAFVAARQKAEGLAKTSGSRLGRLASLQEQGAMSYQPRFEMDALRASAAPATTSTGTIKISASVSAVFELE